MFPANAHPLASSLRMCGSDDVMTNILRVDLITPSPPDNKGDALQPPPLPNMDGTNAILLGNIFLHTAKLHICPDI